MIEKVREFERHGERKNEAERAAWYVRGTEERKEYGRETIGG